MTRVELEKKIQSLQNYFYDNKNTEYDNMLNEHLKTLSERKYQVAIVANMSAGKSTFINALFGTEILPTSTAATTDCATYIYPNGDKKYAKVCFSDNKEITLEEEQLGELQEYGKKDEDCTDSKYHNVESIKLYYPFKDNDFHQDMEFDIIFIDTPGPNSNGGEYAEKHKSVTRQVLNEVNLVLFLFDYTQLDASFSTDEQGLWHTIKKRKEEDKHFEVFFIINKIDVAFNEHIKKFDNIKDDTEWRKKVKEGLDKLENEAKDKVRKHAKNYLENIENDKLKVFNISASYQILHLQHCEGRLARTSKKEHNNFKDHFEDIYGDKAEQKLIEYLGFDTLSEAIINFLKNEAIQNIIQKIDNDIQGNIIANESNRLKNILATLKKPEEEARKSIKKAKDFLDQIAPAKKEQIKKEIGEIGNEAKESVEETFNEAIKQCENGIEDCVVYGVLFLHEYVEGFSEKQSKKIAKENYTNKEKRQHAMQTDKIHLNDKRDYAGVQQKLEDYIKVLLNDLRRDFLDIQTDIRIIYNSLQRNNKNMLSKYKNEIREQIGKELDTEVEEVEILDTSIDMPSTYDFLSGNMHSEVEEAKYITIDESAWYKPWTWFGDWTEKVKIQDEKKYIIIDPKKIKQEIRDAITEKLNTQIKTAKSNHYKNIDTYCSNSNKLFEEFMKKQEEDLKELENKRKDLQKEKESCEAQYNTFNKIVRSDNGK